MLPLSSLRNKWLPLGMEGSISESLWRFFCWLSEEGACLSVSLWQWRISFLLAPSTTLLFHSIFLERVLFRARQKWWSEVRYSLPGGRTDFQRCLKGTWKKLLFRISCEESPSNFSGLLIILVPVQGDLCYWSSAELLETLTGMDLGQHAHKLALFLAFQLRKELVMCFVVFLFYREIENDSHFPAVTLKVDRGV